MAGDFALVHRLWQTWSPGYTLTAEDSAALKATFATPGVVAASLAYYRQNATPPILLGLCKTPAMERSQVSAPVLIINGTDDGCMGRRLFEPTICSQDYPAGVRHEEIADAGHFLHLERPDRVNELILEHMAGG
ncbi:MAG: alpha/beta hydrolase [Actinomycetia bacterium]|nr:alpha/beta hydrolase [Actinomycetes bacterium]